jgi:hypothetical protein
VGDSLRQLLRGSANNLARKLIDLLDNKQAAWLYTLLEDNDPFHSVAYHEGHIWTKHEASQITNKVFRSVPRTVPKHPQRNIRGLQSGPVVCRHLNIRRDTARRRSACLNLPSYLCDICADNITPSSCGERYELSTSPARRNMKNAAHAPHAPLHQLYHVTKNLGVSDFSR